MDFVNNNENSTKHLLFAHAGSNTGSNNTYIMLQSRIPILKLMAFDTGTQTKYVFLPTRVE